MAQKAVAAAVTVCHLLFLALLAVNRIVFTRRLGGLVSSG